MQAPVPAWYSRDLLGTRVVFAGETTSFVPGFACGRGSVLSPDDGGRGISAGALGKWLEFLFSGVREIRRSASAHKPGRLSLFL
jgi:hypothetical protein